MTVQITRDTSRLLQAKDYDVLVKAISDYVPAVKQIKEAVKANAALSVLVQEPACAVWLERLAGSYSDTAVYYHTMTPRDLLAEQWHTELPEDVSDEAIVTSGFLEADIVPRSDQIYEEIVLENFWNEFFCFARFPMTFAGEFINSLEPGNWAENRKRPLAMQALQRRRELWLDQARRRELKQVIEAVFDSPESIIEALGNYRILRGYPPEIGESVLREWYTVFKNLQIDPSSVLIDNLDLEASIQQIRYYLNGLSADIKSRNDLENVLDEMSGLLLDELDWVLQQVRENEAVSPLTQELQQRVMQRFRSLEEQAQTQFQLLRMAIAPPYPSSPENNESVEDWLRWAIHEYLPYRFWQEENDCWDTTVAEYSALYADWFFEHYLEYRHHEQNRWISNALTLALSSLKDGRKVLFIIIDNFNFKYRRDLIDRFSRRGFRLAQEVQPLWSLIPTTTEVGKWALVAGTADLNAIQGRSYEEMLETDWQGYLDDYKVAYCSKIGDLESRRRLDEDLILLNYRPIDTVLHKDEQEIGASHSIEIERYLEALVEVITQFAKRARVEQELDIYIASDHGSTKIPAELDNVLDNKFYQKQAKDRHHRYISVSEKRAHNPTGYDHTHCYVIKAEEYNTREHFFIARGYDRFIKTRESIYVHGGLTPEETIVPFCKLQKAEIEALQPTIRLPNNVIRYSVKANLEFVVGNPNDYDMTNVELNIIESELPGVSIETLLAGMTSNVTILARIKRRTGAPEIKEITIRGSYQLQGLRFDLQPVSIPVEARSLTRDKTEFDFDF